MHEQRRVVQWATGNIGAPRAARGDPPPRPRARGRARLRPGEGRCRRGRRCAARNRPACSRRPTRPRSTHSTPTACCTCRARSTSTTWSRCSRRGRTSSRRAASSSTGGAPPRRRRAQPRPRRVRARPLVGVLDRQQPRLHHRRAPVRAAVAPTHTSSRSRSTSSRTCRGATRRTCCSSRWASASRSRRTTRDAAQYLLGEFRPALGVLAEAAGRPVDAWTASARSPPRATRRRSSRARLAAGTVGRAAHHARRDERRRRRRALPRQLVLHRRRRTRVGPQADRLARAGARRRAARRRPRLPRPARRARRVHPGVHREPPGERDPARLRRAARHPLDGRPPADPPRGPERYRGCARFALPTAMGAPVSGRRPSRPPPHRRPLCSGRGESPASPPPEGTVRSRTQ